MKPAVFLDRDGVINEVSIRDGRPFSPRRFDDFKLIDGVKAVLGAFRKNGFANIIVTNQPDIARGLMEQGELDRMHGLIREKLPVDDIFACPHDDKDNCECRKPKPGMLLAAAKKWGADLSRSFMIGDSWRDVGAGRAAGCTTILVDRPYNQDADSNFRANDLSSTLAVILEDQKKG